MECMYDWLDWVFVSSTLVGDISLGVLFNDQWDLWAYRISFPFKWNWYFSFYMFVRTSMIVFLLLKIRYYCVIGLCLAGFIFVDTYKFYYWLGLSWLGLQTHQVIHEQLEAHLDKSSFLFIYLYTEQPWA